MPKKKVITDGVGNKPTRKGSSAGKRAIQDVYMQTGGAKLKDLSTKYSAAGERTAVGGTKDPWEYKKGGPKKAQNGLSVRNGKTLNNDISIMAAQKIKKVIRKGRPQMPEEGKSLNKKQLGGMGGGKALKSNGESAQIPVKKYGGININPANKGKFTATKKATGKSTEELTHSSNPVTKKRAVFAQNAKKFNHKK